MAHVCAALRCAAFRCYYRHNRDQWNAPVSSVSAGYGNRPSTPIFIAGVGFPLIDTVPHVHAVGSVFDRRNSPMWRRRLASVGYAILSGYLYLYTPAFRCPWGMDNDADMAAQAPSTSAESRDPLAPAQGPPALQAITWPSRCSRCARVSSAGSVSSQNAMLFWCEARSCMNGFLHRPPRSVRPLHLGCQKPSTALPVSGDVGQPGAPFDCKPVCCCIHPAVTNQSHS